MAVAVVQVGIMRVLVPQGLVAMQVGMRLGHRPVMLMLVMAVMNVTVIVLDFLMRVFVLVVFG